MSTTERRLEQKPPSPAGDQRLIVLLGALYVTQGVPLGVSMVVAPTLLRQAGASLETIGFASVAMLPWAIKFLWAPLVDNRGGARMGRRRSWILPLQTSLAILFFVMGFLRVDLADQWTFIAFITLANVISATQDIATDGWAVENLTAIDKERSLVWANGLQVGGFAGGMCLGGPAALIAQDWIGQGAVWIGLGGLLLLTLTPVILWGEGAPVVDRRRSPAKLRHFFSRPQAATMLLVAALFNGQQMMTSTLIKPFLVDVGA